ncbi:HipA domain-containing protein [Litoreibacter janthinus]|uniref:HipA domain-containing protein n=1 Tax=Litoreibacter janthinus TaxID=670154 RepID=UPI000B7EC0FD
MDLADVIASESVTPDQDREELYRRVVFSILVTNIDDHMRNHGFLRGRGGWHLSPTYNINPVRTNHARSKATSMMTIRMPVSPCIAHNMNPIFSNAARPIASLQRWPRRLTLTPAALPRAPAQA